MQDGIGHRDGTVFDAVAIVVDVDFAHTVVDPGEVLTGPGPHGENRLAVRKARVGGGAAQLPAGDVGAPRLEVTIAQIAVAVGRIGGRAPARARLVRIYCQLRIVF